MANATTSPTTGAPPEAGVRELSIRLPARADSVAEARHRALARTLHWALDEDTRDRVALVLSELFTNAVVHTASEQVVCELRRGGGVLRVEVRDQGCAAGGGRCPGPDDERGRGLLLVASLSTEWGIAEDGAGHVVWAHLACR